MKHKWLRSSNWYACPNNVIAFWTTLPQMKGDSWRTKVFVTGEDYWETHKISIFLFVDFIPLSMYLIRISLPDITHDILCTYHLIFRYADRLIDFISSFKNVRQKVQYAYTVCLRACLHQASASMLRQLCDNASDTILIESNRVAWKWVATSFQSGSIVFNENSMASIIAELSQHLLWRSM